MSDRIAYCLLGYLMFWQREVDQTCMAHALIKKKKNFLVDKEIQNGSVTKTYLTNGLLK